MRRSFSGVFGFAALAMMVACGGGDQATEETEAPASTAAQPPAETSGMNTANLPEGVTAEMVAEGKTIFEGAGLCYTCHGPDAKGTTLAPDLTDDQWLNIQSRDYEAIVGIVTNGVPQPVQYPSPMVARGGSSITDDQVRAVAAYVFSLGQ